MFKYKFKLTVTATDKYCERIYTRYGNSIEEIKLHAISILINDTDYRNFDVKIENYKMI